MNDKGFVEIDSDQIPETDIVFECQHCKKQHSIDPRGAGLVINCTECNALITVPIPEGMHLSDLDADPESADALIIHLRKALTRSEARIRELEDKCEKARAHLGTIAQHRMEVSQTFSTINSVLDIRQ